MGQTIANVFYKQRADFLEEQKERDKRLKFPDDVEEIRDIPYLKDGLKAHHLDVYKSKIITPEQEHRKFPVIINVHGGGLILGNKEFNRYFCAKLCKLGYIVFSVEYRLVPDCMFYDQCEDLSRALDFIKDICSRRQWRGVSAHIHCCDDEMCRYGKGGKSKTGSNRHKGNGTYKWNVLYK